MKPVVYSTQRILTTQQLADFYESTTIKLQQNFHNNRDRYREGKDFYCLEGEELKKFKVDDLENIEVVNRINRLYLWTESGALMHAKSLNTDKAWEVYRHLVETYFRSKELTPLQGEWTPDIETDPHKLALAIRCERAKLSYLQAVRALHYPALVVRQQAKQLAAPKPDKNAPDYIQAEIVKHLHRHGSLTLNTLKHSYMKRCDEVSLQRHLNTLIVQGVAIATDTSYGTKRYSLVVSQEA